MRTDICDKASEEVRNLNYSFFIDIIIRVLPVRVGLFYSQGRKVAAEHHYNKPFQSKYIRWRFDSVCAH